MAEPQVKATSELIAQSVATTSVEQKDFASEALVDALRWCFGLLKLAMIVAIVFYAMSGFFQVKENEQALKIRFGKVVGLDQPNGPVLGPGFHAAYPWPIDRIVRVSVGTERSVVSEFVYQLTDQERLAPDKTKLPVSESLVPGKDDYVLTGDANILHVSMVVKYRVSDVYNYIRSVESADAEVQPGMENQPESALVKALADGAVIQAAGTFAVDDLLKQSKDEFRLAVEKHLKAMLTQANCGVEVKNVLIGSIDVARQVMAQFNEVRNATEERSGAIKKAESEKVRLLTETAGPGYEQLTAAIDREQELLVSGSKDYAAAREGVSKLIQTAGGSVKGILNDALAYRNQVVESAKADATYFSALLPKYRENRRVVLTRLLLGTYEDLFDKARKYYVSKDAKEIRLMIDRDPLELKKERAAAEAAKSEATMGR